jgi:hypothetical protein
MAIIKFERKIISAGKYEKSLDLDIKATYENGNMSIIINGGLDNETRQKVSDEILKRFKGEIIYKNSIAQKEWNVSICINENESKSTGESINTVIIFEWNGEKWAKISEREFREFFKETGNPVAICRDYARNAVVIPFHNQIFELVDNLWNSHDIEIDVSRNMSSIFLPSVGKLIFSFDVDTSENKSTDLAKKILDYLYPPSLKRMNYIWDGKKLQKSDISVSDMIYTAKGNRLQNLVIDMSRKRIISYSGIESGD